MSAVINGSKDADQLEWVSTPEDVARNYAHLHNSNPDRDMLFATLDDQVIGYGRVFWNEEQATGTRLYQHFVHILPEWRAKGIRRAMARWNEARLRQVAQDHPDDVDRFYEAWADDAETDWASVLLDLDYEAVRWGYRMVRPDLEDIPDLPLPEGLEVRPVEAEHYRLILAAMNEAFEDHWGSVAFPDEWLAEFQESPTFDPSLWQVAWAGDEVAGMVQNFIDRAENEEYGRLRGYTEGISVRRPWRRQGLARALIARSFRVIKEEGMTEAALGVDAQNPNGALQLYLSMGFQIDKRQTTYHKPLGG
jgi:GNAT superfamily N-acetyltransferase